MNGVQVAYAWLGPLRVPPEYSSLGWFATIKTQKNPPLAMCRSDSGDGGWHVLLLCWAPLQTMTYVSWLEWLMYLFEFTATSTAAAA